MCWIGCGGGVLEVNSLALEQPILYQIFSPAEPRTPKTVLVGGGSILVFNFGIHQNESKEALT